MYTLYTRLNIFVLRIGHHLTVENHKNYFLIIFVKRYAVFSLLFINIKLNKY